jgi:hypothetical protein
VLVWCFMCPDVLLFLSCSEKSVCISLEAYAARNAFQPGPRGRGVPRSLKGTIFFTDSGSESGSDCEEDESDAEGAPEGGVGVQTGLRPGKRNKRSRSDE